MCDGFELEGYPAGVWREMTSEPRRYGFHATLKAPFRLRVDLGLSDLMDGVAGFARNFAPFDAGELEVGVIKAGGGRGFVALKPKGEARALRSLEAAVVRALDPLRAPLSANERERRLSSGLSPRQRYYLDAWGYPYVLDEFRPHFTLTNAISDARRVARALEREFRVRVASHALRVASLALFVEAQPGGDFMVLRQFPLGRATSARRATPRSLAPALD
jgi:hypothetical protein